MRPLCARCNVEIKSEVGLPASGPHAVDMDPQSWVMMDDTLSPPRSLVPHLVGTNGQLQANGTMGSKVRATFSQVQEDIAQLDAHVSRLSDMLSRLVEKRGKLQEYLEQHRALFSPARCVPPEIWGEIFLYCLPPDTSVEDFRYRSPIVKNWFSSCSSDGDAVNEDTRVPWVFTRISRDLRTAALSCPRLWTKVSVCVDDHTVLDRRKLWPLAHILRLSGDLPLSVTLFGRSYDVSAFELWAQSPAAQCLGATSQRWEKLQLNHVPFPTLNRFFSALRNRLDGLKVLEIHFTSELPRTKPLACDVFANAPKLRSLTMTGTFSYDVLHLPMQQLTSCSMHGVLYFPRMIRSCPELVDLDLTLPLVRIEPFAMLKSDRIRTLRLDFHSSDYLLTEQLLKSLDLPSLSTLHLECCHLPDAGASEFFQKNNSITHLTFRVERWSEDSLLRSLRSLSSLEQLCVSVWPRSAGETELLLNNLARRRRGTDLPHGPILPKLRKFELVSHMADFPVDSFVRLVRARWAFGRRGCELEGGISMVPFSPLKSARVFLHGSNVVDHVSVTLAKLNDLKNAGLDVRVYARGLLTFGPGERIL
ncbi:hypothetical protein AX15_000583 [Amanita polypyramis BW_CC]|nr:hypothetical protein AX15_000583 [Amanita polypyramis BW_CC]